MQLWSSCAWALLSAWCFCKLWCLFVCLKTVIEGATFGYPLWKLMATVWTFIKCSSCRECWNAWTGPIRWVLMWGKSIKDSKTQTCFFPGWYCWSYKQPKEILMRTTEFPFLPSSRNCRAWVHSVFFVSSDKELQVTNVQSFTVVSERQYHMNVRKSRTCITEFFRVLKLSSVFARSFAFPQKGNYSCQNSNCIACLGPFL